MLFNTINGCNTPVVMVRFQLFEKVDLKSRESQQD